MLLPFRSAANAAVVAAYLLIVIGGIVRATGSGLGCPDWPLCQGQLLPPPERAATIEFSHRFAAGITSVLAVTASVLALRVSADPRTRRVALLIPALLVLQIVLGAVTVLLELPPVIVAVHMGLALLLLGLLTFQAVYSARPDGRASSAPGFARRAIGAAVAVYVLAVVGAIVRATGATFACTGLPLCGSGDGDLAMIHMLHRILALGVVGHLTYVAMKARRTGQPGPVVMWSTAALVLALVQGAVGATGVLQGFPMELQVAHVAGAAATWLATVGLVAESLRHESPKIATVGPPPLSARGSLTVGGGQS